MTPWAAPIVALLATGVGCVLSALYVALGVTARGNVEELAQARKNDKALRRIDAVFAAPGAHALAVGVFRLFCDLAVVGGFIFWVTQVTTGEIGIPGVWDVIFGSAIALVVLWVFGVAIPMSIAAHAGARLIYSRLALLRVMHRLTAPLQAAARFLDEMIRRLAGVERMNAGERVQEELLSAVEEGESVGALDERDRQMIEAVMKFPTRTVEEIMTPRTGVQALEYTNNLGMVIQTIKRIGHSRIPVFEDNLDHIVGVFYVKDLMKWLAGEGTHGGGKPFDLKSILRPPVVVPWSKTVRQLLDEMIQKKVHIALVADEYGGTAGLVTIEDIFEEIVGDIKDEYEPGPADTPAVVLREDERRADVDASARIDEVNQALAPIGVEIPESDEYDTVGGFVTTTLGRIPQRGETFQHERMTIRILDAKPTRVVRVGIEARPVEEAPAPEPESETGSVPAPARADE